MQFTEYVPDYLLRNYLRIGQTATILGGSTVAVHTIGKTSADVVTSAFLSIVARLEIKEAESYKDAQNQVIEKFEFLVKYPVSENERKYVN